MVLWCWLLILMMVCIGLVCLMVSWVIWFLKVVCVIGFWLVLGWLLVWVMRV